MKNFDDLSTYFQPITIPVQIKIPVKIKILVQICYYPNLMTWMLNIKKNKMLDKHFHSGKYLKLHFHLPYPAVALSLKLKHKI